MFPATKPQQRVSAASLTSNVDAEAANATRFVVQNPDGDRNQPLAVCRVCLARSVKMYHMSEHNLSVMYERVTRVEVCRVCLARSVKMYLMSEHNLSVMYERVTRVEVHTEDKLPKMLCWECVARLSSANNFIDNALKTQWILLNKIIGERITMSDIESIDRAQYQLESTLGVKYYEVNNTDLHILRESDIAIDDYDASNAEVLIHKYENRELREEHEQFTIKSELLDVTGQEEADLQRTAIIKENLSDEEVTIDSDNISDILEEKYHIVNKEREVSKAIKQEQKGKHLSAAPFSNWSKESFNKGPTVIADDMMLSFKNENSQDSFEVKAEIETRQIKQENLLDDGNNSTGILTDSIDIHIDSTNTTKTEMFRIPASENTSKRISATTATVDADADAESSQKLFVCDLCDKSYQRKANLIRHIQGHLNLYSCTYCNYKTYTKGSLSRHVNTKHTKNTVYNCSYCDYKTYDKSSLRKHANRKHTKNTVYNCSYCSHKAYDKGSLNIHVNAKHTKDTVYTCSYCDYKTYDKSCLYKHVNRKHTKNTVYKCSYCSHKAYDKGSLNIHVNAKHTKNAVYNCSYCTYKAYDKSGLSRHVNTQHTKNTVYNCSYCSYRAYDKTHLIYHINSKHTKSNVFKCSHCSYKAYLKSSINRHVKAKHAPV